MSDCTHDCSTCGENCSEKAIKKDQPNEHSTIKKVYAVVSGKGGVGKSMVTSMLSVLTRREGYKVGVLDADILGPSIPKGFGIIEKNIIADENNLMKPKVSRLGVKIMSSNLLLDDDEAPIIYRGSLIAGMLQQFYQETNWGELDYLFIDMPPGTGDVPLTTYQSIPIDKVIIVTSPQDLVSMIVSKSINMADTMNIDVLGVIENMSYVVCPDCNAHIEIFGKSKIDEVVDKNDTVVLAKLPLHAEYSRMVDEGMIEDIDIEELDDTIKELSGLIK